MNNWTLCQWLEKKVSFKSDSVNGDVHVDDVDSKDTCLWIQWFETLEELMTDACTVFM